MIIPERLQLGTTYEQALVPLNANFDGMAQNIADFNLILEAIRFSNYPMTLASGEQQNLLYGVFSSFPSGQIGGTSPAFSIFVDPPDIGNPSSNYLYPDGASVVGGMRSLRYGGVMLKTGASGFTVGQSVVYGDKTWYYVTDYVIWMRNLDGSAHTYLIVPRFKFLSAPQSSVYR